MHESKVLQCFRSRPNHRSKRHPLHSTGVFKDVNRKGRITVKEWTHSKCTPYGDPSLDNMLCLPWGEGWSPGKDISDKILRDFGGSLPLKNYEVTL